MSCAVLSVLEYLKSHPTISHTRPSPKHVLTAMDGLHGFPSALALPEKDGCRRSMKLLRDRDIYNILSRPAHQTAAQLHSYSTLLYYILLFCTVLYPTYTAHLNQSVARPSADLLRVNRFVDACQTRTRPGQGRTAPIGV